MAPPLLHLTTRNALATIETGVSFHWSHDAGASWVGVTAGEQTKGLSLPVGDVLIRATKPGLFTVTQGLQVTASDINLNKPNDTFGVLHVEGSGTSKRYMLTAWMTLFREADLTAHNWGPVPKNSMWIYQLSGPRVLSGSGSGFDRLAGTLKKGVEQHDPASGRMVFLETRDDAKVPHLFAVFVPSALSMSEPVQCHTFFMPFPSDEKPYPWGKYFGGRVDAYLVSADKRLLHQHGLAGKKSLFVLPMPNQGTYFSALQRGPVLKRTLQEILFTLTFANGPTPLPELGYCVVSGYSRGGSALASMARTSLGQAFDELKEIYSLDSEPNSAKLLGGAIGKKWLGQGGRRLRIYVGMYDSVPDIGDAYRPFFATGSPRTSGPASEWTTSNATYFYAPKEFWQLVRDEEYAARGDAPYFSKTVTIGRDRAHHAIPQILMTHALAASGIR